MFRFSWHRDPAFSRKRIGFYACALVPLLFFATGTLARHRPSLQDPVVNNATADPATILRSARVIAVRSSSVLVKASTIEEKLRGRSEFHDLRLVITRDESGADLILELEHDLLTKYVYTAIDPRTHKVVATGKVSSLGGTVAGKVAKRFLKQVARARM